MLSWEFRSDVFVSSKPGVFLLLTEVVNPVEDTVRYPSLLLKLGLALVLWSKTGLLIGGKRLYVEYLCEVVGRSSLRVLCGDSGRERLACKKIFLLIIWGGFHGLVSTITVSPDVWPLPGARCQHQTWCLWLGRWGGIHGKGFGSHCWWTFRFSQRGYCQLFSSIGEGNLDDLLQLHLELTSWETLNIDVYERKMQFCKIRL